LIIEAFIRRRIKFGNEFIQYILHLYSLKNVFGFKDVLWIRVSASFGLIVWMKHLSEIPTYQVLEGFDAIRNLGQWFHIRNLWPLYSLKMFPMFVSLLFKESLALIS
jgi:hypothetical protein